MSALKLIQIEAKKLRAAKPTLKYIDAIKLASKKYNAGKLGATNTPTNTPTKKKKAAPKLPVKKIVTTVTKEKITGINEKNAVAHMIASNAIHRIKEATSEISIFIKCIEKLTSYIKDKALVQHKILHQREILVIKKYIAELNKYKNSLKKFV